MGTYADVDDVRSRLAWFTITADTSPDQDDVSVWIDEAEAILDAELLAAELPAPYTAGTRAAKYLRRYVCMYAVGMVLQSVAKTGVDGVDNLDGQELFDRFDAFVDRIRTEGSRIGAALGGGDAPDNARMMAGYPTHNTRNLSTSNGDFDPTFNRESAPENQF